jgi:HEAT repeat protein
VVDALGEIGDTRAIKPLIKLLGNKDRGLRSDAGEALCKIGRPAVEPLVELLKNEDSVVRIHAAYTLGRIGDDRAIVPLILALWDVEKTVPLCVSDALDKIDCDWTKKECAQKYLSYFAEALMKGNIPVKFHIIDILEKIGDPGVSEILTKALEFEEKNVQSRAAKALERIKNVDSR